MGKNSRNKGKKPVDDRFTSSNSNRGEDRFAAAETRPQFKVPKARDTKVVLDERFSSVLTDSRFQLQEKDKYGRKKKKKRNRDAAKEDLESFYVVENKDDEKSDDDEAQKNDKKKPEAEEDSTSSESDSDSESDVKKPKGEKGTDHVSRIAYLTALSRGEIDGSSSSEEEDSSDSSDDDDDSDGEDSVFGTAGVLDPSRKMEMEDEIEITYDSSPYLVVTDMDWENIRAVDLFCLLSSFAPPGAIKKVQVFQSDFGMEQMAKDKLHGPTGIWQKLKKTKNKALLEEHSASEEEDSDDDEDSGSEEGSTSEIKLNYEEEANETDFDPEKLRAYEASKLKYYFAVTEVSQPEYADIIYREVDGMEFEHSSTAIDLRTLPIEALESVVADRPMRDEATSIPGKYEPPDFVVSALQQTNVQCTWDQGDKEREKKLTGYGGSNWHESFEADDLKAYIASDNSSDEDSDDDDEKEDKKSSMRKALGLDSDSGSDAGSGSDGNSDSDSSDDDSDDESDEDAGMSKQMTFIPGKSDLEVRIRSKLESKDEEKPKELTPWEKYQEKRKQKRKERRQAARGNKNVDTSSKKPEKKSRSKDRDDFFASDGESDDGAMFQNAGKKKESKQSKQQKAKEQLELLLAGEHAEEEARDYDIRGIQRMEKNKGKKLKGSRKRKEAKKAADVSGSNFKINVNDDRFKAVLDGSDGRFGIDKTDPNYKETAAMRDILSEQTKRRKNKRQKKAHNTQNAVVTNQNGTKANTNGGGASGASALSFLVQKLKSQVDKPKN